MAPLDGGVVRIGCVLVSRDDPRGQIPVFSAALNYVGPGALRVERIHVAADDVVTVDLTSFVGVVSLTREQLGELVGTIAAEVWRAAPAQVASSSAELGRSA